MKVIYFHQHFSTPKGAAGIRSYQMARCLLEHGHEVLMVCGSYSGGKTGLSSGFHKGKREGIVDGIKVIEFNLAYSNSDGFIKRSVVFLKFAFRSMGLALTQKYDVMFATSTPLTAGLPGIIARCLRRKPFVFEVRDLWPELPREMGVIKNPVVLWLMSVLEWCSYHAANRCIGLSPGIVDGIVRRGIDRSKVLLVPNGCDLDIFDQKNAGWRPGDVKKTDFMAVYTGTHGVANGLDALLDVAKELKARKRSDIKLVLLGHGNCKALLVERAQRENLNNILFYPPVEKQKLAGLMVDADIGLQLLANIPAFYYGTSPNKFFDYISAGLPVLNNYPGWLADIIKESDCGYSVQPDDAKLFADALEIAASDKLRLSEQASNARKLAETSFDRKKLSEEWVAWLEGAVK